jgi:hypothetical protein
VSTPARVGSALRRANFSTTEAVQTPLQGRSGFVAGAARVANAGALLYRVGKDEQLIGFG